MAVGRHREQVVSVMDIRQGLIHQLLTRQLLLSCQ